MNFKLIFLLFSLLNSMIIYYMNINVEEPYMVKKNFFFFFFFFTLIIESFEG